MSRSSPLPDWYDPDMPDWLVADAPDPAPAAAPTFPSYTIASLRFIFTRMFLTHTGRLKKSVRFHVGRVDLGGVNLTMLCGRQLPHDAYTTHVHAATWDILPVCPHCREIAERDYSGFETKFQKAA